MDELIKSVLGVWPIVIAFVGLVAWFVKIKGQTEQNTVDIKSVEKRMSDQRKEDVERIDRTLGTIAHDIKTLLQRSG